MALSGHRILWRIKFLEELIYERRRRLLRRVCISVYWFDKYLLTGSYVSAIMLTVLSIIVKNWEPTGITGSKDGCGYSKGWRYICWGFLTYSCPRSRKERLRSGQRPFKNLSQVTLIRKRWINGGVDQFSWKTKEFLEKANLLTFKF